LITRRLRSNKIAERVSSLNMGIMLLVLVLISIVAMLTMTRIAMTASLRLAYIHSLESVGNFNLYAHGDLALLRMAARTAAVREWFADEDNLQKKQAAFNELMNFAPSLRSMEFYLGMAGSLNEYTLNLDTTFEDFAPYDRMAEGDPIDAWFFDLLASEHDFLFNIDVDKIAHRWRIWINYKVVHDGQVAGVLSTSLRIDNVMHSVFGRYDEGSIRGFVIDNNGLIHIGSTALAHYSELKDELIHISSIHAALGNLVEDFVGRNERFFDAGSVPKVARFPGVVYNYAAIVPIANSDWMIVTLFNSRELFSMINLLPLVAALVSALVLYMFISTAVMRRCVLKPLTNLTESVSQINDAGAENVVVYGSERKDEIRDLSSTIQHMWDTLRAKNLDLQRTAQELGNLERLLQTVNNAASALLAVSDRDSLGETLTRSMEMIGRCLEADRVQLWHVVPYTDRLSITLSSQWLSELGQQNPQTYVQQEIPYGTLLKSEETLLQGECFNGPVANLPPQERRFIGAQGDDLKSVVVIPVFLHGKLWGFSVIAYCADECILSNEEMNILRSASSMIASTYQRVELATTEREAQTALQHRERLLHTVNQAAEILLSANAKDTMKALMASMEVVGRCVDADRVQIWRNEIIDGDLYFVMRYEWLSEFGKQKIEVPIGLRATYSSRPGWLEMFMKGESINLPISKLPPADAAFLGYYEMISIVILPLFYNNEFLGFFRIDDCRRERIFTDDEMNMFASAGLMFTNVFNRSAQRELALTDALTGAGNRRCLMETAEQELRDCVEKDMDFSIIMIDIDHFKSINDRYGHAVGDTVLRIMTSRIRHALKHDTLVTRYGGEEFVVTLPGIEHGRAIKTAWRIQKTIEASTFSIEGLEISITASFGVAYKTPSCTTLTDIIDRADKALYQAKGAGRNTVVGYDNVTA